jgi:hypothetical protein
VQQERERELKDKDRQIVLRSISIEFCCGFVVVVIGWIVPGAAVESHAYFFRYPVDRMTCSGRQPWVRPCATLDWTNVRKTAILRRRRHRYFLIILFFSTFFFQLEIPRL